MKRVGVISTIVLSLALGIAATAYAQQDQHDEKQDHPEQQKSKQEHAKPSPQHAQKQQKDQGQEQQHAQQQQQKDQQNQRQEAQREQKGQHDQQQQAQQQQQKDQQNQRQEAQREQKSQHDQQQQAREQRNNHQPQHGQDQRVEQTAWQQHGSHNWDSDHRDWQERGGYHGYHIPEARFQGYFGPDHGFRIQGLPFMVVAGYPRFQYQGYWISLVDPWPSDWGNDWYDNDDVYVGYVNNGYYLYNSRYPGVGIAINISM